MYKKEIIIGYRIFFALLAFSSIVTEIAVLIERGRFNPANFFSFFTIESNAIALVVFMASAFVLARGKQSEIITVLRGASTFNMILVGVVFSILLSGLDVELTAVPWDNIVLHYIMPVVVALDWFIDQPGRGRVSFKQGLVWMVFPLLYVIYSLVRGAFVGWYPYPFLNPVVQGYSSVALTSLCIAIGGCGLVWMLTRVSGQTNKR